MQKKCIFFQGMVRYVNFFKKVVNLFRNQDNLIRKQS